MPPLRRQVSLLVPPRSVSLSAVLAILSVFATPSRMLAAASRNTIFRSGDERGSGAESILGIARSSLACGIRAQGGGRIPA